MTVTTDLRFFDKERALKNTFPGIDCGNKKCLMICAETLSAAQTMRLNEKQAVEKAIQQHILPEFHCTPAMNHQLLHQNVCRFGFYPEDRTILPLSSKPPKLKLKQFVAGTSACKKCKELDGKIVTHLEERDSAKMQQKGFYKQNDKSYAPHPHCKCGWSTIPGKELSFVCEGLGFGRYALPFAELFDGLFDLFKKIKAKELQSNSVTYLLITAHGVYGGNAFPVSSPNNPTTTYMDDILSNAPECRMFLQELKRIMAPMGIIELRMCEGVKDNKGENIAQKLANATGCIIKAYVTDVNALRTKRWKIKTPKKLKEIVKDEHIFTYPSPIPATVKYFYPQTI